MSESDNVIFNLSRVIGFQLEADGDEVSRLLKKNKVVVTILQGPSINIKSIKLNDRPTKRQPLPKETVEYVKRLKLVLKGNTDAVYLLTILSKAQELVKKLDYSHLNQVGANVIESAIKKTITNLAKADIRLLEHIEK